MTYLPRLTLGVVLAMTLIALPAQAQDSFHVLDEACIADKVSACAGSFLTTVGPTATATCPRGWTPTEPATYSVPEGSYSFPLMSQRCALKLSDALAAAELTRADTTNIDRCVRIVRANPNASEPRCLVKVDTGRLINSLERDITLLIKQVCEAQGGKNCGEIMPKN